MVTKWPNIYEQKCSLGTMDMNFVTQNLPLRVLSISENFRSHVNFNQLIILNGTVSNISENLISKGQRSRSPYDQIWANCSFWDICNYKGGFLRPLCDIGILSQPAGRGIPSSLQHQFYLVLSLFYFTLTHDAGTDQQQKMSLLYEFFMNLFHHISYIT